MFFNKIGNFFLQGILYMAPITVTVWVFVVLFRFVDGIIPVGIPGLGIIAVFLIITLTGIFAPMLISKPFVAVFDNLIEKAPLVKIVYSSVKDLVSAFVGKEKKFTQPVLVKVNKISNLEKIGFITQSDLTDLGLEKGKVSVFFPHSYAFTGELFIVPSEDVTPLDVPSSEIMKFIISGGITKI